MVQTASGLIPALNDLQANIQMKIINKFTSNLFRGLRNSLEIVLSRSTGFSSHMLLFNDARISSTISWLHFLTAAEYNVPPGEIRTLG